MKNPTFKESVNWEWVSAHQKERISADSPFIDRIYEHAKANGYKDKSKITKRGIALIVNLNLF
jgi:hypothetical protein